MYAWRMPEPRTQDLVMRTLRLWVSCAALVLCVLCAPGIHAEFETKEHASSSVAQLTDEGYSEFVKQKNVAVLFTAPWCMQCKLLSLEWEELAAEHEKSLTFATMDTSAHPSVADRLSLHSQLPAVYYYRDGLEQEFPLEKSAANIKLLADWMAAPAVKREEKMSDVVVSNRVRSFMYFGKKVPEYFSTVAKMNFGWSFYHMEEPTEGFKEGDISAIDLMFRKERDVYEGPETVDAFAEWINENRLPLTVEFGPDTFGILLNHGKPVVVMVVDPTNVEDTSRYYAKMEAISRKRRKSFAFAHLDGQRWEYVATSHQIDATNLPAFFVMDLHNSRYYYDKEQYRDGYDIEAFLDQIHLGSATAYEEPNHGEAEAQKGPGYHFPPRDLDDMTALVRDKIWEALITVCIVSFGFGLRMGQIRERVAIRNKVKKSK